MPSIWLWYTNIYNFSNKYTNIYNFRKCTFKYQVPIKSGLLQVIHKYEKWQWCYNLSTWRNLQIILTFSFFFPVKLVTRPSFMSISSLILELWQYSFIMDWPAIHKSKIPTSEFRGIFRDWGKLGIQNLA